MTDTCEWIDCEKAITHFVIHSIKDSIATISWSCMYHYCKYYNIDIKEEAQLMKIIKRKI